MLDRRITPRRKTFLGGRLAFNNRHSSMDCILRNLSDRGAKLAFGDPTIVPVEFDLQVDHQRRTVRARVVWRLHRALGITFLNRSASGNVVRLDEAIRIRDLEAHKAALQRRVRQLGEGEWL